MNNKRSKDLDFYLSILDHINNTNSIKEITKNYNISKQSLQYHITLLKNKGLIKKVGYGTWELCKDIKEVKEQVKELSLGTKDDKPETNLHALQINIPILKGKIHDKDWEVKEKLRNWIPKYKKDDKLQGLTIKNNNNKSITVFAKERSLGDLQDVYNLAFKIKAYMNDYFKKEGVILDLFNCETKNLNLATQDKNLKGMLRKGEKFQLDLNKISEKIFPKDHIPAKAWLDNSPKPGTAETNDLDWKREYLSMPFRIRDSMMVLDSVAQNLAYVAENYKSHVKMVEQGTKVNKESLKLFKKFNSLLSQKKLKDYF